MPKFFIISEEQKIGNRNGKENKGRILHGGGLEKQSALRTVTLSLACVISYPVLGVLFTLESVSISEPMIMMYKCQSKIFIRCCHHK